MAVKVAEQEDRLAQYLNDVMGWSKTKNIVLLFMHISRTVLMKKPRVTFFSVS